MQQSITTMTSGRLIALSTAALLSFAAFFILFISYDNLTKIPFIEPLILSVPLPFVLIWLHDHFHKVPKPFEKIGIRKFILLWFVFILLGIIIGGIIPASLYNYLHPKEAESMELGSLIYLFAPILWYLWGTLVWFYLGFNRKVGVGLGLLTFGLPFAFLVYPG